MFDILEQPWTLLGAAVISLIVIWIIKAVTGKQRLGYYSIPILIAAIAMGLYLFVPTDTKKIKQVIKIGAKAVEDENAEAIIPIIAENYHDSIHPNKESMIEHCGMILSEPLVSEIVSRIVSLEINSPNANAVFTMRLVFDDRSFVAQSFKKLMLIKIRVEMQKQNKNWYISRVELLEMDMMPAKWSDIKTEW
jgi:hypothetical protein